jgi:glycosyltransferase involved in cell wall biosynthesis
MAVNIAPRKMVKVLVIGQTPPPFVGQFMSLDRVIKARYPDIRIYHTRMNYSQTVEEIGKVKLKKIIHLFRVILESAFKVLRHRIDIIYYPPASDTVPILRDIATLLVLRCLGRKLVLVFQASGLCETVASWKGILLWLFRKAFLFPDAAIQKSTLNPPDAAFVKARAIYTMPNGSPDEFERFRNHRVREVVPIILFVGIVREDKGVGVLIEAARLLRSQGRPVMVKVVGEFASEKYHQQVLRELADKGLTECVQLCGGKIDDEKWTLYRNADIFCFPSYYPSESFGNVLVEAMMFELPVVSTLWRGIPSIVNEGETGFLVEIRNAGMVAERLAQLLDDEALRTRMGRKGRERYLEKFTVDTYLEDTRRVLLAVAGEEQNFDCAPGLAREM